jgi:hypothetical protein
MSEFDSELELWDYRPRRILFCHSRLLPPLLSALIAYALGVFCFYSYPFASQEWSTGVWFYAHGDTFVSGHSSDTRVHCSL